MNIASAYSIFRMKLMTSFALLLCQLVTPSPSWALQATCGMISGSIRSVKMNENLTRTFISGWTSETIESFLQPLALYNYKWMLGHLQKLLKKAPRISKRQMEFSSAVTELLKKHESELQKKAFADWYTQYLLDADRFTMAVSFLNQTESVSVSDLTNHAYINAEYFKEMNQPYRELFPYLISISIPQDLLTVENFARAIGLPVIFNGLAVTPEIADGQLLTPYAFMTHDKLTHAYPVFEYWLKSISSGQFERTLKENLRLNRAFYKMLDAEPNENVRRVAMAFVFKYFRDYFQPFNFNNFKHTLKMLPEQNHEDAVTLDIWIDSIKNYFPETKEINHSDIKSGFRWLRTKGLTAVQ